MFLNIGSKGALVKEIQAKLMELGFDPGSIDEDYGEKTREAVVSFQESKGLKADGIAGPICLAALGIEVKPVEPETERESFKLMLLSNPNYFGYYPYVRIAIHETRRSECPKTTSALLDFLPRKTKIAAGLGANVFLHAHKYQWVKDRERSTPVPSPPP